MLTFAAIILEPGDFVAWMVAGLLAGALAGYTLRGGGYGLLGDLLLGLVGAVVGGFLCGLFVDGSTGFWGTVIVAFLGACALIALLRAVGAARRPRP